MALQTAIGIEQFSQGRGPLALEKVIGSKPTLEEAEYLAHSMAQLVRDGRLP